MSTKTDLSLGRLPTIVVPEVYAVKLWPDVEKFIFQGEEKVKIQILEPTDEIVVNSHMLAIDAASVSLSSQDVASVSISMLGKEEMAVIKFPTLLPAGSAELNLRFNGQLLNTMEGFYRSKYTARDGSTKHMAVTQFEPGFARRAFPCWDEPAVKAVFDITLVVPKELTALSNAEVTSEVEDPTDPSKKVVTFGRTPLMSSYLVAVAVGDFDYIEGKSNDGVLVRVYAPPGRHLIGQFALEVACKTLPFYKEYFGIGYPMSKCDLIAVPDFNAGAMENWGLVTFRETALLYDPKLSSASGKQRVAIVVGHELAHQWFGNLVTMKWWNDLWLNEGFASWIEYLCVDHCCPDFNIWTQFAGDYVDALRMDSLKSSHPIEADVKFLAEINEIFDSISYNKGASIINMLHDFLGDEVFRAAMNHYLTKFQYKNAATCDLWESMSIASGLPIGRTMKTWTEQMGFPMLLVEENVESGKSTLSLKQKRFFSSGDHDESFQWIVPVSVKTSTGHVQKYLLEDKSALLELAESTPAWIKVNPEHKGYYRTLYSYSLLQKLMPVVKSKALSTLDRFGIQNDLFALGMAGYVPLVQYLDLLGSYVDENEFCVLSDIISNLARIRRLGQYSGFDDIMSKFTISLLEKSASRFSWDDSTLDHQSKLLRSTLISTLGHCGHEPTISKAKDLFAQHVAGTSMLPPDISDAVYSIAMYTGDSDTYDQLVQLYERSNLEEERVRLLRNLGSSKDLALVKRTFEFCLTDHVRPNNIIVGFVGATTRKENREELYQFITGNWSRIVPLVPPGFTIQRMIEIAMGNFVTEERALEIEAFFKANPVPDAERTICQAVERIRTNAMILARDGQKIKDWLERHQL